MSTESKRNSTSGGAVRHKQAISEVTSNTDVRNDMGWGRQYPECTYDGPSQWDYTDAHLGESYVGDGTEQDLYGNASTAGKDGRIRTTTAICPD